jgi:hypothetical protein
MEGVILFADDHIESAIFENTLFKQLKELGKYPVFGVDSLDKARTSIISLNSIKALIIDYSFIETEVLGEEKQSKERFASEILEDKNLHIFSLIYVYSQNDLKDTEFGKRLVEKFGSRVNFRIKSSDEKNVPAELTAIMNDIGAWEKTNSHLSVPFMWNRSLNQAIQNIFHSLDKADPFWVKDLYYSSFNLDKVDDKGNPKEAPPVDPNIQVINLFQNLLAEKLIQDSELRNSIEKYSKENFTNKPNDNSLQELYQRLYYTPTLETDVIMTGDVYALEDSNYGIIISPECDMNTLITKNKEVELLCFYKSDFNNAPSLLQVKRGDVEKIKKAYNQEHPRFHILPVFPVDRDTLVTAFIDFRFSLQHVKADSLTEKIKNRNFKINSPYIQQLRQRYLSYLGRVGVPTIPNSLRITK